jgi:hypothetical protein
LPEVPFGTSGGGLPPEHEVKLRLRSTLCAKRGPLPHSWKVVAPPVLRNSYCVALWPHTIYSYLATNLFTAVHLLTTVVLSASLLASL